MRLLALLMLCSPLVVQAEDARLDAIHALLLPMRTSRLNLKARGATPALTTVKHQLRDWIESRLSALQWNGLRWNQDPVVLQEQLNDELRRAELFCGSSSKTPCPESSELGFLGPVVLDMKRGAFLVVRTAVGIQLCGYDESAYAYQSSETQWRRFWQSEQNDYDEGKYFPQWLHEVLISPTDFRPNADKTEHLILTLGTEPWCTSNWHDVYYRVWQTKGTYVEPVLLLSGSERAFVDDSIHGSVNRDDLLIEYAVNSVEGGFTRPEIRHYVLEHGRLERVDPIALSPRNFTAFWLSHPWPENSRWTAEGNRSNLEKWLQRHKGPFLEFGYPTLHCKQQPDLWQVATDVAEDGKGPVYFLIRWRPPYHFTMVSAGDHPWPNCTEEDREADEPRSLFPVQ
jgi:hypothetical protein